LPPELSASINEKWSVVKGDYRKMDGALPKFVMAGLVPAIHVFRLSERRKTWMPGTRPGMTNLQHVLSFGHWSRCLLNKASQGLWVPAFAGTT
jgi:hypothetical protein